MTTSAVERALTDAQAAKAAYREDPSVTTRADHRYASTELRYARWIERGGPAQEKARLENELGHTNGEVAVLYARWLDENPEG